MRLSYQPSCVLIASAVTRQTSSGCFRGPGARDDATESGPREGVHHQRHIPCMDIIRPHPFDRPHHHYVEGTSTRCWPSFSRSPTRVGPRDE